MTETVIGLIVGLVLAIAGFLFGRRSEQKHTVVRDSDILDGVHKRAYWGVALRQEAIKVTEDEKRRSEEVSKKIKEAPNEEIVSMFVDAFGSPAPTDRTRRGNRGGGVTRHKRVR